ncbi:SPOCS domain-containing protein [Desulforamulus aeronauticus]|uniref:SipL SPOCS domain-containing protein n=1 Tax=Desulforamulus aeronauticus DSM 10349 TaxID=1121421 RepID=A0A1M6TQT8_9FIRM|nr:SPOCS domain-containing protein [Desulforamulus aeronauticus]SHK59178.1 protein of unknown function [Desulforamulus aeronauticus DSM 10349]
MGNHHECEKNCGRVQLLCESVVHVKPPMTKIVGERFKVNITDYTTYSGNVVVKGCVEKITMYLHEHDHKNEECCKNSKHDCKKDCDCDSNDCDTYLKKSFCKQVKCNEGVVHYLESIMEFNAVVEIPCVKCGDHCHVTAKVKDIGDFVAIECDKKGHVTIGKENYILDVKVCCAEPKSCK